MNLDLSRALDELAESATAHADLGPAERIVRRRRRRRAVRRAAAGATSLVVVGGLLLAGTALAGRRTDAPQPAATGPATTSSPTPAWPPAGCFELPPEPDPAAAHQLAVTVVDPQAGDDGRALDLSVRLTGSPSIPAGALQDAEVRVVRWGTAHDVIAVGDVPAGGWTDGPDGPVLEARVAVEGCGQEPWVPHLTVVVRTADGLVVSGRTDLEPAPG